LKNTEKVEKSAAGATLRRAFDGKNNLSRNSPKGKLSGSAESGFRGNNVLNWERQRR
jgi:hypothetical protein